jgi:hypothetical protein
MTCCGKKRAAINYNPTKTQYFMANSDIWFQYTGTGDLIVIGKATQLVYQFSQHQRQIATDPRDYRSLITHPSLRQTVAP